MEPIDNLIARYLDQLCLQIASEFKENCGHWKNDDIIKVLDSYDIENETNLLHEYKKLVFQPYVIIKQHPVNKSLSCEVKCCPCLPFLADRCTRAFPKTEEALLKEINEIKENCIGYHFM